MKRNKGFSLIELIVGIVIFGVLSGITALSYSSFTYAQKEKRDEIIAKDLTLRFEEIVLDSGVIKDYENKRNSVITLYWVDEQEYNGSTYIGKDDGNSLICTNISSEFEFSNIFRSMNACMSSENLPCSETGKGFTLIIRMDEYKPTVEVKPYDCLDEAIEVIESEDNKTEDKPFEDIPSDIDKIEDTETEGEKSYTLDSDKLKNYACDATKLIFNDGNAPTDVILNDLSDKDDMSVVGWYNGNEYIISTRVQNIKVKSGEDCTGMFSGLNKLETIDFRSFDTSMAVNMNSMFAGLPKINQLDLSMFDARNVKTMCNMFAGSSVEHVKFESAGNYMMTSEDLVDISGMFKDCKTIRQVDINDKFEARGIKNMNNLFNGCTSLNDLYITSLKIRDLEDISSAFKNCVNLQRVDLSNFHFNNITNMNNMFEGCKRLGSIDLSGAGRDLNGNIVKSDKLLKFDYVFQDCYSLYEVKFGNFNPVNIESLTNTFYNCFNMKQELLNQILDWDLCNLKSMNRTFGFKCFVNGFDPDCNINYNSDVLNYDFSKWKGNLNSLSQTFYTLCGDVGCISKVSSIKFGKGLDTSNCTSMDGTFRKIGAKEIDISNFNTKNVTTFSGMFYGANNLVSIKGIEKFDFSSAKSIKSMFGGTNIEVIDFSKCIISDKPILENIEGLFSNCRNLKEIKFGKNKFNTEKATSFKSMFDNCYKLEKIDTSYINTGNANSLENMFAGCSSIKSLDLSKFNTSSVEKFTGMFSGCKNLSSLDVSNFSTVSAKNMSSMFKDCVNIGEINVSKFNTEEVTDVSSMFENFGNNCENVVLNLKSFNMNNVIDATAMFANPSKDSVKSGINKIIVSGSFGFYHLGSGKGKDMFKGRINLPNYNANCYDITKATYSDLDSKGYLSKS